MDVDVLRRVFDRHMTARGGGEAVITAEVLQERLSRLGAGVSRIQCKLTSGALLMIDDDASWDGSSTQIELCTALQSLNVVATHMIH